MVIPPIKACPSCLSENLEQYPRKDEVTCWCEDCSTHFIVGGAWQFPPA